MVDSSFPVPILIVDDDEELCGLVSEFLSTEGFQVDACHEGSSGLERALSGEYELVILDVMLPQLHGLEVLRRIRQECSIPILMLTAKGDDLDRIIGLEAGADDYLSKPFNPRELAARIRAILRRGPEAGPGRQLHPKISVGDVELDPGSRAVMQSGEEIHLTTVEFEVLQMLLEAAGSVVNREQLVTEVLGRHFYPHDRSIDMHISKLRRKLGDHADGSERIRSVRGVGYLYAVPSSTVNF